MALTLEILAMWRLRNSCRPVRTQTFFPASDRGSIFLVDILPSSPVPSSPPGISDFLPADIDIVGYRVFLGNKQYFVSSDVGGGKMQW